MNTLLTNQSQNLVFIAHQTKRTLLRFYADFANDNNNNIHTYPIFLYLTRLEENSSVQFSFKNFTLHLGNTFDNYLHYNILIF